MSELTTRARRLCIAGLALACAGLPCFAAISQPRLVVLDVVAVDKQGLPVMDVTSGEFLVSDSGKPREIAFFHHTRTGPWQPPRLAPDERSNRSVSEAPHATVILFDLLNQDFSTWPNSANRLVHDLRTLTPNGPLYLYLLTVKGILHAVHGVPGTDGMRPDRVPATAGPEWTRNIKALMEDSLRTVLGPRLPSMDIRERVQLTYEALGLLALQLSRAPGRKTVVWITDGVPLTLNPRYRTASGGFVDFSEHLRRLSERLDHYSVSIYPVRQGMLGDASGAGSAGAATLDEFAGSTGGRPDQGKGIRAAVIEAMNDVRGSYRLGYYRPVHTADEKFHKLRVTCTRRGVRVEAKTGYYDVPAPPDSDASEIIGAALETHFDAAEIAIRGVFLPNPKDSRQGELQLRIDAGDISFSWHGDRYQGHLRLALANILENWRVETLPVVPFDIDIDYRAADQARLLSEGISVTHQVKLGPLAARVRVIVFDRNSNAVGSLTIPIAGVTQDTWR